MRSMRLKTRIVRLIALAGLASAAAAPLFAAPQSQSQAQSGGGSARASVENLKSSCQSDIKKYCSDISPGEGRVAACLKSKEDKISDACSGAMASTKAKISKKMDRADVAFRKSCGNDVQRFCSNVPSGRGRLLKCLDQHENSLSDSCKKFESALNERLSNMMG